MNMRRDEMLVFVECWRFLNEMNEFAVGSIKFYANDGWVKSASNAIVKHLRSGKYNKIKRNGHWLL